MNGRVLFAVLLLTCTDAQAHAGETHIEHWWSAWNWDPLILSNLALFTSLYALGIWKVWRRAGAGHVVSRRQGAAYFTGIAALFVALISPLDVMSGQLSSAHMVQHMTLMNVAAPLLVLGSPAIAMLWALPLKWRNKAGRFWQKLEAWRPSRYLLWQPLVLWSVYALTLWIWHLPKFYQAALRNEFTHDLQHLSFLIASCLFWRVLLDPISRFRLGRGLAVLYLFATSLHATALGVYMALSPRVWYPDYETTVPAWNLTALEDQQLAGLIMWMPACMIYAIAAAVLFGVWLQEPKQQSRKAHAGGRIP